MMKGVKRKLGYKCKTKSERMSREEAGKYVQKIVPANKPVRYKIIDRDF